MFKTRPLLDKFNDCSKQHITVWGLTSWFSEKVQLKLIYEKVQNSWERPGVVASAVIPCDGTVEIGRLDAVNPPHTST